jgi:hypothetical protein
VFYINGENEKLPQGKKPLERPSHRWKDNIKIDISATIL